MKNQQNIFFCTSVGHIPYFNALYDSKKKTIIVTYLESVKNFFDVYFSSQIEIIYINSDLIIPYSLKNPLKNIEILFRKIFLYQKYFSKIENSEVYFFSTYYLFTLYFISKLARRNSIFYFESNSYKQNDRYCNKKAADKLRKILTYIMFNIKINYMTHNVTYSFLDDIYFRNHNIKFIAKLNINRHLYSDHLNTIVKNKKILLLPANVKHSIPENSLIDGWKIITEILLKRYSHSEIILKNHPRNIFYDFGPFKKIEEIDSFIPSEFLFRYEFDFVITIYSNALKQVINYSKSPIINVMKLFDYISINERDSIFESLETIQNKNYFCPNTFTEFKNTVEVLLHKDF